MKYYLDILNWCIYYIYWESFHFFLTKDLLIQKIIELPDNLSLACLMSRYRRYM